MKMFTIAGLFLLIMGAGQVFSQVAVDNPNLDQVPPYIRERINQQPDAPNAPSAVVTIGNWDNFSLGVDFGESNMSAKMSQPAWFFTAYNTNAPHHTENGIDWTINTANFGASMQGDPVVCYDSLGNLFYENMYGTSSIQGCKVLASTNNGASWGTSVTAISGVDKNWMACDQTSGPYANNVYTTMTASSGGNFARSTDHGITFANTWNASTQNLPGMMPAVGPQGNIQGGSVYVVTNSGSSFAATYTFYVSHDGGATFTQKSAQNWANYVGTNVGGRNSVSNMRTRPYPMIAADNSYGPNRGKLYCVYASNFPSGNNNKSDVWCRSSTDDGANWSSAVRINDDPGTENFQQWHPAIWCDKETGKLYAMWMDTRDVPTNDSAYIYASYSTDGGATWVANQRISNAKMKIDCPTCGGGGTPRYEGDYNGVISNRKVSMIGWTDFRSGSFQSMTAYFPDYAMALDKTTDTLYSPVGTTTITVSFPEVKLYSDSVYLSATINPVPTAGTITFSYPSGNSVHTFPSSLPVVLNLNGSVPTGTYQAVFVATGPNGTPAHKRIAMIKVMPGNVFMVNAVATPGDICQGQTSQLNASLIGGTAPFTYAWTPAASLSDPTLANPVATPGETTMYHVLVTDAASKTSVDSVQVVVNHAPTTPGPITGSQVVCKDSTAAYSIAEVSGSTSYSWTVPADATILSGQNTTSISLKWAGTSGSVSVQAGNTCGTSIASVLPVSVEQPPTALKPISGPDAVCRNTAAKFFTSESDASITYTWTVPSEATIISGQGTDTIHVNWGTVAGDVTAYATNNCGGSPIVSKTVSVTTVPEAAGVIAGKDTVCQTHGNYVYTVPTINGATEYVWTLPNGATITAGQGTNSVTLSFSDLAQSGNLIVAGKNDCGEGSQSTRPLVVENCAGIGENQLQAVVQVYPNPVSGQLTVSISGKERQLTLNLTDMHGKVVYTELLPNVPASFTKKLDMSAFAKGIYFLRVSSGDRVYSEKVIVQ